MCAEQNGIAARLYGGAAVWVRCVSSQPFLLPYHLHSDCDLIVRSEDRSEFEKLLLRDLNLRVDPNLSAIPGESHARFYDQSGGKVCDVAYDQLIYCHTIPVGSRLAVDRDTIPLAELLLSKLQNITPSEKDLVDVCALLLDHRFSNCDGDEINLPIILGLCNRDWGLEHTLRLTAFRALRFCAEFTGFDSGQGLQICSGLAELLFALEESRKSLGWRLRGMRRPSTRWFNEVSELPDPAAWELETPGRPVVRKSDVRPALRESLAINANAPTRVFFATDIHASNLCFRKFLGSARMVKDPPQVIIIGGDITGKYIVSILKRQSGWEAFKGNVSKSLSSESELATFRRAVADQGGYTWLCEREEFEKLNGDSEYYAKIDKKLRSARIRKWVEVADEFLAHVNCTAIMNAGNDDPWYIDEVLRQSKKLIFPEGLVLHLEEDLTMISTGVANMTPWKCPRDVEDEEVGRLIELMASQVSDFSRCIFNIHCPPFDTLLDQAPKLDEDLRLMSSGAGVQLESVGSRAVREAIEHYQPLAGLHGHIHESVGIQYLGKTACVNPGSEYQLGRLNGVMLEIEAGKLRNLKLVQDNS